MAVTSEFRRELFIFFFNKVQTEMDRSENIVFDWIIMNLSQVPFKT